MSEELELACERMTYGPDAVAHDGALGIGAHEERGRRPGDLEGLLPRGELIIAALGIRDRHRGGAGVDVVGVGDHVLGGA